MGEVTVPKSSWNGGEIGARAQARVDLTELYPKCSAIMENCWGSVQGPLSKVPGTEYYGATPSSAVALLRPFIYGEDDVVLLELSNEKIRFVIPDEGYISIAGAAATIGNFTDSSDVGATATTGSTSSNLTATDSAAAKARSTITTAAPTTAVTLAFTTTRRPVKVRVGSSAGGQQIVSEITFQPGVHRITFTPGVSPYYFQATLDEEGEASIGSLTRIAAGVFELPTPWATADLPDLRYEQDGGDAMWWCIAGHQPRVLERRGEASWSLRLYLPEDGPFDATNISDVTMTPDALSGSATITASEDTFVSGDDEGRLIALIHQGQTVIDNFDGAAQESDSIRVTGVGEDRIFQLISTGTWTGEIQLQRSVGNDVDWADYGSVYTTNQEINVDDGLDNQIIYYRVVSVAWTSGDADVELTYSRGSTTGYARVVSVTNATTVETDVLQNFGATTATRTWALGAWSDGEGWPVASTKFDGRLWLVRGDRIFGSVSDDYESHLIGSDASAAVDRFIATGDVNSARWIEGASRLLVGTSGAAVEVKASSFDEPITPDNMNARSVANRGKGAASVQAEKVDKRIVYVGKNRKRLYQLVYDLEDNSYAPDDLTRLHKTIAGALADDGFVEIAVQYEPEPRVWAVREDGQLAVLTYAPEEQVYAWCRFKDDGAFYESVCVLPGTPEDHVFFVVRRTIDNNTVRYVEKLMTELWENILHAGRLRCSLSTENPADNVISGLDHLEGEEVWAWAGGRIQGPFEVESGDITLADDEYNYVMVGLNYVGYDKSGKLSYGARQGTALCQEKTVDHVGFVTHRCPPDSFRFGFVQGDDDYDAVDGNGDAKYALNTWPEPDETTVDQEALAEPLVPISRDTKTAKNSGSGLDPRLVIVMDTPAPVEILGAVVHLTTAG